MTWGKSVLLTIPLILSGIFVVPSPATAERVGDERNWTTIDGGGEHTCGIRDRDLNCWGSNASGQVGNGGDSHQDVPDDIGASGVWASVSAGDGHTCAITTGRSLYCWGANTHGQIGDGTTTNRDRPRKIGSSGVWAAVAAGGNHTCAVTTGRSLYCWGANTHGQIGDGTTTNRDRPRKIGSSGVFASATAGGNHTCAITTGRSLYCWGANTHGQIGDGTTTRRPAPRKIGSSGVFTSATAGGNHTCAITTGRSLYCWGANTHGQIGDGTTTNRPRPRKIGSSGVFTSATAGGNHTCTITTGRSLYCWGANTSGQIPGGGAPVPSPRKIGSSGVWTHASAGGTQTCAISTATTLYCWGGDRGDPEPSCSVAPYARPNGIDLSHWKLTTPLDLNNNGTADEIRYTGTSGGLADLDNQYYYDKSDVGGTRFRARADGATTSEDTQYARSELREMTQSGGYDEAAWDRSSGTHRMRIYQRISHTFEEKPEVVAGQIHDGSDDVLQIRLEGPELLVTWNDGSDSEVLDSSYTRGAAMDLLIQADECGIAVKYNFEPTLTIPVGDWDNGEWYFKAGVYNQSNTAQGDAPTSYGEVTIVGLDVDHSS